MIARVVALVILLGSGQSQASFILQMQDASVSGKSSELTFTPESGNLLVANVPTFLQGGDGTQFLTSFGVAFQSIDTTTGTAIYSAIPGDDQFFVRNLDGSVAYQGTIFGQSLLFHITQQPGDVYSLSIPALGHIGPDVGDHPYPVSMVYTFDLEKPEGLQTFSGFIVYGERQPGGGGTVPEPGSWILMGSGLFLAFPMRKYLRSAYG